jgi:nitrate/nitrite transporter NarK
LDLSRHLSFLLVGALIFPLGGLLADNLSLKSTIVFGGILLIPSIIFYSRIKD